MIENDVRAVERVEDQRFLTGEGQYVDDLAFPGMLHAAILRSQTAHGMIRSIDLAAAKALTGVHAIVLPGDLGTPMPRLPLRLAPIAGVERFLQTPMAVERVRYVGEPLAIVVAESRHIAEDALDLIEVDIDPLPVVADTNASRAGKILIHPEQGTNIATQYTIGRGDIEAAFKAAEYTRKERFRSNRQTATPMETRGLIAAWDEAKGRLSVHGAGKVPHTARRVLCEMLQMPTDAIDMIEVDIGGGFGVRGEVHPEDYLIPATARLLKRTVKWIEDRREHLTSANHSREIECELEIACKRDGTILGLRGTVIGDMGAFIRPNSGVVVAKAAQFLLGPYRIANFSADVEFALTNKTPIGTYRGPGRYESNFFRERLFDMAAADLGIDPADFRFKNLITPAEMPYKLGKLVPYEREAEYDTGDFPKTFRNVLDAIGYERIKHTQGKLIDGRWHGIGVAACVESSGPGPREHARLKLGTNGGIEIYVGSSNMGQGLETIFSQIAGDALGLPLNAFAVFHGSTTYLKEGLGTYASRAVVMGGSAVLNTAQAFAAELVKLSAEMAGVSPDSVTWKDGRAVGSAHAHDPATLAAEAAKRGRVIDVEGVYESTVLTWSPGAHAAYVAVDARTGHVKVLDYVAIEDVGRAINPALVHGQAIGGLVQGLGGAFLDHLVYDSEGQLLTGSFADYLLPIATDFPNVRGITMEEARSPSNPLGAKGAGECSIAMAPATVVNAIAAALRPLGATITDLPVSPPRVFAAIRAAASRGS